MKELLNNRTTCALVSLFCLVVLSPHKNRRQRMRHSLLRYPISFMTVMFICSCGHPALFPRPPQIFREDLRQFGYIIEADSRLVPNFTDLNFLSDDLVLVSINQSEEQKSKLLLFDISRHSSLRTIELDVAKKQGAVKATRDGQFVALTESGLRVCSSELTCGPPLPTKGSISVSPAGTRVAVGGYPGTDSLVLDSSSLKELERFTDKNISVIPGDTPGYSCSAKVSYT